MPQTASPVSRTSDDLVARVCLGTPIEAQAMARTLPASDRARLALFCNARAHLRAHGREIARLCTEADLTREGGFAGGVLLRQINAEPDHWGEASRWATKKISLGGPRPTRSF